VITYAYQEDFFPGGIFHETVAYATEKAHGKRAHAFVVDLVDMPSALFNELQLISQ
jgi:hypothetical protein